MAYSSKCPYPYVKIGDYSILPDGTVLILNESLSEEIKQRLIADIRKDQEKKADSKEILYFE